MTWTRFEQRLRLLERIGVGDDEDEILERELGKVGEEGAKIGAELAGDLTGQSVPAFPGEVGARVGAERAAERLPKNTHEVSLTLEVPAATAVARAYRSLTVAGRVLTEDQDDAPENPQIVRGIVKAGFLNMNPAVVTITITPQGASSTAVEVRGAAKEGRVKQRAGKQAAERIAALLSR